MSIWEGLGARRIKDSAKAQEMANMMSIEAHKIASETGTERPTARDYEAALDELETLQEAAKNDNAFVEACEKLMQRPSAAFGALFEALTGATGWSETDDRPIGERLSDIGSNYEKIKESLAPARERLERLKTEAEARAEN